VVAAALEQVAQDRAAVGVVVRRQDGRLRVAVVIGDLRSSSISAAPRRRRSLATRVVRLESEEAPPRPACCLGAALGPPDQAGSRTPSTALLRSRPSSPRAGRGIFFSEMKERMLGGRCSTAMRPSSERSPALEQVLELAHGCLASRTPEVGHRLLGDLRRTAGPLAVCCRGSGDEEGDVRAPLAQGGMTMGSPAAGRRGPRGKFPGLDSTASSFVEAAITRTSTLSTRSAPTGRTSGPGARAAAHLEGGAHLAHLAQEDRAAVGELETCRRRCPIAP